MSKLKAVLISDVHFNINTLDLAGYSLSYAFAYAHRNQVPLIVAGDLHDTKAIIRAEVANVLLLTLKLYPATPVYILVGNHDLINEKGKEHGLNYLKELPNVTIIDTPRQLNGFNFIPYQSTNEDFIAALSQFPLESLVIAHQGFQGAFMGEYIQDKSSVPIDAVKGYKVISGHYHRHQTIGTVTYIGTPYSITFAEANDGSKGIILLNSDNSTERIELNRRKHIIIECNYDNLIIPNDIKSNDLLWLKIKGPYSELKKLKKDEIGRNFIGHSNFKLDLIQNDVPVKTVNPLLEMTETQMFDSIIENTGETKIQQVYLKKLYREILKN